MHSASAKALPMSATRAQAMRAATAELDDWTERARPADLGCNAARRRRWRRSLERPDGVRYDGPP